MARVVLSIESIRRITGVSAYSGLVDAIERATHEDEDEFIEWKSNLDLSVPHGAFHLARAILGFANRDPQIAFRRFDGCAYVVVGVEPGAHPGVTRIDPAQLTAKVDRYVGGVNGPAWEPRYVDHSGVSVLVVTVEAPRAGDPGWPLRKAFNNAAEGTLFVRRKGSTNPASSDEVAMLFQRVAVAPPMPFQLVCRLLPDKPLRTLDVATYLDHVRATIEQDANAMRVAATETLAERERQRQTNAGRALVDPELLAKLMPSIQGLGLSQSTPDRRTIADYELEVDQYVEDWSAWAESTWPADAWTLLDDVHIEVLNPTDTYLTGVRVELRFDDDRIICLDEKPDSSDPPAKPRGFGEPIVTRSEFDRLANIAMLSPVDRMYVPLAPSDTWIQDDGTVVFAVGNLHPRGDAVSDPIRIIVPSEIASTIISARGSATAEGHHRVIDLELTAKINR